MIIDLSKLFTNCPGGSDRVLKCFLPMLMKIASRCLAGCAHSRVKQHMAESWHPDRFHRLSKTKLILLQMPSGTLYTYPSYLLILLHLSLLILMCLTFIVSRLLACNKPEGNLPCPKNFCKILLVLGYVFNEIRNQRSVT